MWKYSIVITEATLAILLVLNICTAANNHTTPQAGYSIAACSRQLLDLHASIRACCWSASLNSHSCESAEDPHLVLGRIPFYSRSYKVYILSPPNEFLAQSIPVPR